MTIDLPINKIGRVDAPTLRKLKNKHINTIGQLAKRLENGSKLGYLSEKTGIDFQELQRLGNRVKLRQIRGIGTIFELLLEQTGIVDIETLAKQDKQQLWQDLAQINQSERLSRRSPTPEEVDEWVDCANAMIELKPPITES